jgi:hypothetical protein
MPNTKSASPRLRIFDQNGQPAVSGVPSPTGAIFDVAVGQGGDVFVPDTVNISVGDTGAVDLVRERTQCHERPALRARFAILFP